MIDFECPHCHETLKIPEQYLGSRGTCKRCGKQITVLVAPPPVPRTSLEVASVSPSPVPSIDSTSFPRDVSRRSLEAWVKEQVGAGVPRQHLFEFLGRKQNELFDNRKTRDAVRMVKQDIFHVMVERNLKGRDLEKSGKEDVAITLYEENVADRFDGSHPYDRLRVIYTRRKDFDGAIRVCQQYIELSGEEGKRGKFQEHLNKLYVKKDNLKKR